MGKIREEKRTHLLSALRSSQRVSLGMVEVVRGCNGVKMMKCLKT
jgi:hypothetical protein